MYICGATHIYIYTHVVFAFHIQVQVALLSWEEYFHEEMLTVLRGLYSYALCLRLIIEMSPGTSF